MIFLPRTEYAEQEKAKTIVEQVLIEKNFYIYGWRQVPVNPSILGITADTNRPEITQVIFKSNITVDRDVLERQLFVARKKILKITRGQQINDFYICSLSSRSILYKGMFLAETLSDFTQILEIKDLFLDTLYFIKDFQLTHSQTGN